MNVEASVELIQDFYMRRMKRFTEDKSMYNIDNGLFVQKSIAKSVTDLQGLINTQEKSVDSPFILTIIDCVSGSINIAPHSVGK